VRVRLGVSLVATTIALAASTGEASAQATFPVVMSGLDNPRGLAFARSGALYVAEAGRGGAGPCLLPVACYGTTGAVTRLYRGRQVRIATGLPSHADPTGAGTGAHDVVVDARGRVFVLFGLGFAIDPAQRTAFGPGGANFGKLVRLGAGGALVPVADIAAYEATVNPGGPPVDSNPFGLLRDRTGWIVAEAGGNSLLRVASDGAISTLAVFPSRPVRPTDSVPTSVVRGRDGGYYVGELTGGPFAQGAARVYRVMPGQPPQTFAENFTAIIDIAIGRSGRLYVLQHATQTGLMGSGALIRVSPDGTRTTLAAEGLVAPMSVAIGFDGDLYVSNRGVTPGAGEVVRIAAGDNLDETFCVVPRLRGRTVAAARTALARAHCTTGTITRVVSGTVPKGRVIASRPRAGTRLAYRTSVRLLSSLGPRPSVPARLTGAAPR
jgi:PASTA domain